MTRRIGPQINWKYVQMNITGARSKLSGKINEIRKACIGLKELARKAVRKKRRKPIQLTQSAVAAQRAANLSALQFHALSGLTLDQVAYYKLRLPSEPIGTCSV